MPSYPKATKQSYQYQGKTEYYWLLGDIKNPPVLLLPGLTGYHSNLLEFARNLKDDFFLILPDLPGWGDSPRLDRTLTLTNYAHYLHSLLEDMKIGELSIFGHCMGASLTIEFAHLYPDKTKKLILLSVPYEEGRKSFAVIKYLTDKGKRSPHFLHPIYYFWENRYLDLITGLVVAQFKSFRKRIRWVLNGFREKKYQDWNIFDETWSSLLHFNYKKIRDIKAPIHFLAGEKDLLIEKNHTLQLQAMVPHASLEFMKEAGHMAPVETPDTLARLVKKYLLL